MDISCSTGSIIKYVPYTRSIGNTESRNDIFVKRDWVDLQGDNVILPGTNWKGQLGRLRLKSDGTRAEARFRLSAKRTSPFKSAGASVQSTTGSRGVRISGSNAGYTMFRGRVRSTGYPPHSPVSPSLPLPCVTACHHISTGLYTKLHSTIAVMPTAQYRVFIIRRCISPA